MSILVLNSKWNVSTRLFFSQRGRTNNLLAPFHLVHSQRPRVYLGPRRHYLTLNGKIHLEPRASWRIRRDRGDPVSHYRYLLWQRGVSRGKVYRLKPRGWHLPGSPVLHRRGWKPASVLASQKKIFPKTILEWIFSLQA